MARFMLLLFVVVSMISIFRAGTFQEGSSKPDYQMNTSDENDMDLTGVKETNYDDDEIRGKGISYQVGKVNVSNTRQEWNCSSGCEAPGHCTLPRCTDVIFPQRFGGLGTVHVFVSLSHERKSAVVHSPSALWADSINVVGFQLCLRTAGITNDTGIINWLAFQDQPHITHGSVNFSEIWTTETKCEKVTFSQRFVSTPYVFVSAKYSRSTKPNDAVYVWLENVNSGGFEVCIREFLPFDGKHQDTMVDWFAFLGDQLNFTITGEKFFPNKGNPSDEDNYGFCEEVPFNTTFYEAPVVLVAIKHRYDRKMRGRTLPENNILSTWVEEIGLQSMRICAKDLHGSGPGHDPLTVSYAVIGDLSPCLDVHCPRLRICKTYSAHDARCECNDQCPSYQDPVCSASGTTYGNKCWYELSYCKGLEKNTVYHPGSCEGFPIVRGRVELLHVPKWSDSSCQTVAFPPYRFYPDKQVHVQVTVNHMKLNDSVTVHDAVTSWTENINTKNFTVCAMQAGRGEKNVNPFATIDWVAYQGAPPEGLTGTIMLQKWWSGTNCANVTFPKDKFDEAPVVLVTSEHLRTGKEYDAALIWTEDVTKDTLQVCLREMQNFDGRHEDINVNWFAFSKLHKPLFTEHGAIKFPNTNPPLDEMNNAYCKFVVFQRSYNTTPTVLISANHSTKASGNTAPIHNGITTWIENMNVSGFRVCVKELYENRYDPLSVSYAVLTDICDPGWSYFNGYCYFTSEKCTNWTTALTRCRQENSVLVDVNSNEENVYLQHVHNGAKSWLGLNDISTEGNFTWADRGAGNFTAWAKNQPNNFGEEDCVHTLGIERNYEWNDVKCSDCHQYTCKKDFNECEQDRNYCHQFARCINYRGSFKCNCNQGYDGDGFECQAPGVSCEAVVSNHPASGRYELKVNSKTFKVYCDVTSQGTSWTLIARFSNNDAKTWMRDDGLWWYDQNVAMGTTTDPSVNADMISQAFWLVSGREFKITRSDDSSHAPLLQTTGNCLGGQTFRSKVTSYGNFRHGKVWSSDRCLGSCTVQYGGQYKTTDGFQQAACSSSIQSSNKIGFWCDWSAGDGSVMMIGGGGKDCARADHGIGITETDSASFVEFGSSQTEYDFGYDANIYNAPSQSYSLNLWIR